MRKFDLFKPALAAAVLLSVAVTAHADITAYNSQAGYLAAVGTTGVDTFDDVEMFSNPGPAVRNAGDFAYTLTAGPEVSDYWGPPTMASTGGYPPATRTTTSPSIISARMSPARAASSSAPATSANRCRFRPST